MTSFWSLAALLAFGLVGHATAQQYRWSRIVGSCTHTCGPIGVRPSLIVCFGPSGTVDEVFCDRNTRPPYQAPEACNRIPCAVPPVIAVPQPLVQNPPIPGGSNAIAAGQNVQIHANNSLWIDVNMVEAGTPTATFSWSLPGGETVNAGETSGRFQVHNNGTLVITNIGLGDEGDYEVTASNSADSDSITSTVTVLSYRWNTVWSDCSATCGPGTQSASIFCLNVKSGGAVVVDNNCQHLDKPELPSPRPCVPDNSPCPAPPMIFEPDPLVQPNPVPYQGFTVDVGQNVSVHQGESLRVNARIVGGVPDPSIEWTLPDGTKLGPGETSNGVRITPNGALRINDVRLSDDGTYTVTATNSQGTDTASTTLTVLLFNWETIRGSCTQTCGDQGITPFLVLCRDEKGATVDAVNCNSATRPPQPFPEPCNRVPCPEPPVLAIPDPLNQTFPVRDGDWSVTLGQNVTILKDNQLTIDAEVISGLPTPTITWALPDGTTLSAGESSGRVSVSPNGRQLTVQGIQDSDRGSYVATAENSVGTVTGTTAVTVIEPPVFRTPPTPPAQTDPIRNVDQSIELGQDILIRSGNELVIDAVVTEGSPNPSVVWTLPDGGTLGPGERSGPYRVSPNGRRLRASNMQVGDGGMFVATATNDAGTTTGRSQVTVVEPPVLKPVEPLDEPSPIPNEDFSIDVNQDVFILAGRRLLVNAELTEGSPPASIAWSLPDGSSLSPGQTSGRYRALANGSLEVTDIELGDEGVYTVTATNRAGSVTGSTTVTVRRFRYNVIIGSCTHTCGPEGVKPSLIVCMDANRITVDEVNCGHLTRPVQQPPEECNRIPCPVPPGFVVPEPLDQVRPIPCENLDILLGQNAIIKGGQCLVIVAQLQPGAEPAPSFVWTLPSGETLGAGERAENVRVNASGTRLTVTGIATDDAGLYIATASNSEGSATLNSTITVERFSWSVVTGSCTRTCGTEGIKPSIVLCQNVSSRGSVDEINCCAQKPVTPLPEPCNRIPCPTEPVFIEPDILVQTRPLPCANVDMLLGQHAIVHEGYRLVITAQLDPGVTPAPTIVWTLPSGATLGAGESSGNARVNGSGTRLTVSGIAPGDVGSYNATATNSEGSDTLSSTITVDRYSWDVVVGSCTHTCGPLGIKPALVLCKNDSRSGAPVDEANCCAEKPATPLPEPCNRIPCPTAPEFDDIPPLVQVRPIPCENLDMLLGQDAIIKEDQRLVIVAQLKPGVVPDPSFVWTLPSGETLGAGGRSGNVRVNADGTRLTVAGTTTGNAGLYSATATNSEGSATLNSTISIYQYSWNIVIGSCTHTCGPLGIKPALVFCRNDSNSATSADEINCCTDKPTTPPPAPCNRVPCPVPPKFFDPPSYNQSERLIPDQGQTIDVDQDVLIIEGNRLVIRARVVEGIPDPDVQWTLPDGSTLGVNERRGRFSVREDGQLVVENIQLDDEGTFTATATNTVDEDTAVSRVTVIRKAVIDDKPTRPPLPTDVPLPKDNQRIDIGDRVIMRRGNRLDIAATVIDRVTPPIQFTWTLPDGRVLRRGQRSGRFRVLDDYTLRITDVEFDDDGSYRADVTNIGGSSTETSELTVIDYSWRIVEFGDCSHTCGNMGVRGQRVVCWNEKTESPEDNDVQCTVEARPTSPPPVSCNRVHCPPEWEMTGRFGECSATCEGTQTEVVVCKQLRRNGDVIDVADNRCPQPKPVGQSRGCPGSPVVPCIIAPEFIDTPPSPLPDINQDLTYIIRQQAEIVAGHRICVEAPLKDGTGIPRDQTFTRWVLPDGTVLQQGEDSDRVEVSENGTLCINFADERHTGTYKAIVENGAGKDEAETPIQVFRSPAIILEVDQTTSGSKVYPPSKTQTVTVVPQDLITLDCNATGTPPPIVVWLRDGEEIDPTSRRFNALPDGRLQINDVNQDDTANYTCTATNRLGEVETTLTLTVEQPPARWVVVREPCSVTCGTGTRLVLSECQNRTNGAVLPKEDCAGQQRPIHFRENCKDADCEGVWVVGPFSDCSASCDGVRTRDVFCEVETSLGIVEIVDDSQCLAAKPASQESCGFGIDVCPLYLWNITAYSDCSARCGSGAQSRNVTCIRRTSNSEQVVSDSDCFSRLGQIPRSVKSCTRVCTYEPGPWGQCNFDSAYGCGSGTQSRTLTCRDSEGNVIDGRFCEEGGLQGIDSQSCFTPCQCENHQWDPSPWSDCTRSCGGGRQTRRITCNCNVTGVLRQVSNSECAMSSTAGARPEDEQSCNPEQCPCVNHRWSPDPWSDCSVTCGDGVQTRNITCSCYRDGVLEVDRNENLCSARSSRPSNVQECRRSRCKCPTATWSITTSGCSKSCGNGTRVVLSTCMCDGVPTDDFVCVNDAGLSKPPPFEYCNPEECPCVNFRFQTTRFSPCNKPCGDDAVETRLVTCTCRIEGNRIAVATERCENEGLTPPDSERSCAKPCQCDSVEYVPGPWSDCTPSCDDPAVGDRVQTRDLECLCTKGGVTERVNNTVCDQYYYYPSRSARSGRLRPRPRDSRPATRRSCDPCSFGWTEGRWSSCARDCRHRRTVTCIVTTNGVVVNESNCYAHSSANKPETEERCEYTGSKLPKTIWEPSAFGPCSANCGIGVKRRAVTCVNACTRERADGCRARLRPSQLKACFESPCDGPCRDRVSGPYCERMASKRFCDLDLNFYRCCASCHQHRS